MPDPIITSDDIAKKLSRRYMLRNSAITATGVVLLPSFITGCNKDVWDKVKEHIPGGGVGSEGGTGLSPTQLAQAAANLTTLRQLLIEVYELAKQYDDAVFGALNSTKPDKWTNFIVDLFIDIAVLIAGALAAATGGGAAMPAVAFIAAVLKDWGFGKDRPNNLQEVYAQFEFGRVAMQQAIETKLSHLVDPTNNYINLQTDWKDADFEGKTYTLLDLASVKFTLGDEYNKLQSAAYTQMQKAVWNLLIMQCCGYWEYYGTVLLPSNVSFTNWARQEFYPKNKGRYLRGKEDPDHSGIYYYAYWNLGIGDNEFPDTASQILFIDDTPDHTINENGLFHRSYVFEQFSLFKYRKLTEYHEIATNPTQDFATLSDDWKYTGGMFPRLVQVDPA